MILLNFAHPLTQVHLEKIEAVTEKPISEVRNVKAQFDHEQSFAAQVKSLVDQAQLSPEEWQTRPILINPPTYHVIALTLLAELHGRMGYFPAILRLKPVPESIPQQFEVAEIINLQTVRDAARLLR